MRRKLSIILCVTLLASNISVAKITSYAAETQDVKVEEDTLEETQTETTEDAEIAVLEEKNATRETDDLKAERGFQSGRKAPHPAVLQGYAEAGGLLAGPVRHAGLYDPG